MSFSLLNLLSSPLSAQLEGPPMTPHSNFDISGNNDSISSEFLADVASGRPLAYICATIKVFT